MSDFIKVNDKVSEDKLNVLLEEYKTDNSLLFCVYTTKFSCTKFSPIEDITHALELRLFDEYSEFKAVRANMGREFVWRYITDDDVPKDCTYDEVQYLDTAKNDSTKYTAIGGGEYEMPDAGYDRVVIRHYGDYDKKSGMFSLGDFRIVKLLREGEK